jgi:predicted O-linked N-acetylglucosamine transferase (SPINDLY family)
MTIAEAFSIAVQHHQGGRLAEAEGIYRQILAVDPRNADALHLLGVLAHQMGKEEAAMGLIREAIALAPDVADYHFNLGEAHRLAGRLDEAVVAYHQAIALEPTYSEAHSNLGNAFTGLGRLDEAIAAYRQAIALRPAYPEAHNNLGVALNGKGQLDEAVAAYRQAIALQPDYAEAHSNLGNAFNGLGRMEEAIAACQRAIALKPDFAEAHSNLLLDLHYLPGLDPGEIFREHVRFGDLHARPPEPFTGSPDNARNPERPLRIGYLSPDFREHPVAFFLEGFLAAHDRAQLGVYCYSDVAHPNAVTARLRQHATQWRNIFGKRDEEAAELIRGDQIDILVDLAGHTAYHRLLVFARKPSPVQVTWLGYCDTTGMKAMDYRVTDAFADPPGTTEHLHSEELVRLPDIFASFLAVENAPPAGALPAVSAGHVTFGSFHTLAKINDTLLGWWARILGGTPGSRLLMVGTGLDEASQQQRLRDFFGSHGIEPARVCFKGRQTLSDYLALHREVDVLLDSHPFAGHTTGCHALWMGVPVVTLAGKTHCSRMVGSVLHTLGLPEWIAATPEEYVSIACGAVADLPRLAQLRATLRERMKASPLMDAPRFARNMEAAYRQMWRAWCAKQCSHPNS